MALKPREERKLRKLFGLYGVTENEAQEFIKDYYAELDKDDDGEVDEEEIDEAKETTQDQTEEAEENIEAKGEDSQDDKDRIDESVGEQEKLDGDEDSQDAEDRVDESIGEEKAEEIEKVEAEPVDEEPAAEEEIEEEAEEVHEEEQDDEREALKAELDNVRGELGELKALFEELRQKVEGGSFGASSQLPPQDGDEPWVGPHTRAYFNR